VPNTRGAEVSRATQDILREVDLLSQEGVKEVTLLGQNVNSYSYEYLDADNNLVEVNFALLLRYVAKNTNITRIRFFTSHPIDFTDELIEVFRDEKKLVSHLHLPVQSGSDNILSLMKRQHNIEFYKKIIDKLRQVRPDIYFSSDFIVGFPNETEEDFKATLELIKYVGYDLSFSFIYSPRPGTYAMDMEDNTALDIKKDRLIRIQQLLKEQTDAVVESMIGSVQRVLVNGFSKRNLDSMQGRSENNRIIHFPAVNPSLIGKILDIEITRSSTNCLLGKMV
jgi:tRNA-2-methylthio-N6-dimethylallyladenosine synthase